MSIPSLAALKAAFTAQGGIAASSQVSTVPAHPQNALVGDIRFRGLKYRPGDLVRVLPPFGINDTAVHRHDYEANYKNRVFTVVNTRIKAVQLAVEVDGIGKSVDAEEVAVLVAGQERHFYTWFLKRYDGLEVVFDVLETITPTVE